ncbi:MAG: glycosyltransferase [Krumholzibacteria bacterium]|nr:glycosyltransferase [Candidatus Krumholzibacteria bacterium]
MKILVNASNLVVGGGVQKAVQFVRALATWGQDHQWHAVISPQVEAGLGTIPETPHAVIETASVSPARLLAGRVTTGRIARIEREFAPDVVFSVCGPVYQRFRATHAMGFAVGWLTHPSSLAWQALPSRYRSFLFRMRLAWYAAWVRQADGWILETHTAAHGMTQRLDAAPSQLHVVPNCCSDFYFDAAREGASPHPALAARPQGEHRLLVFTSYKPHKNLEIIPAVAAELRRLDPATPVRFVFTLPDRWPWHRLQARAGHLGVADLLVNVGPVPAYAGPELYAGCSALFMPTVLETFSAAYPEAMCMQRPIITSDLDFARDICGDAAAYFDPTAPRVAADAVLRVLGDPARAAELVARGRERLPSFGTGQERFQATLSAILTIARDREKGTR